MHKAWHLFHFKPIKTKYFHLDLMLLHIKVLHVARGQTQNMFNSANSKRHENVKGILFILLNCPS